MNWMLVFSQTHFNEPSMGPLLAFLCVLTTLCFWDFLFYKSLLPGTCSVGGGIMIKRKLGPSTLLTVYLFERCLSTCSNDLHLAGGRGHSSGMPLWNSRTRICQYNWHPICQKISYELTSKRHIITGMIFFPERKIKLNTHDVRGMHRPGPFWEFSSPSATLGFHQNGPINSQKWVSKLYRWWWWCSWILFIWITVSFSIHKFSHIKYA